MDIYKLEDIIKGIPIYGSFEFQFLSKIDEEEVPLSDFAKNQLQSLFSCKKIDIKCIDCNKEHAFDVTYSIFRNSKKKNEYTVYDHSFYLGCCDIDSEGFCDRDIVSPEEDECIISYIFRCTKDSLHYQTMELLYTLKDNIVTVRKIGQKPINTDLIKTYSNEYKNILKKIILMMITGNMSKANQEIFWQELVLT
ncbi:hypothetical protein IKQ02_03820 [bacterium]|nr:hypothetical protein [bacterium]